MKTVKDSLNKHVPAESAASKEFPIVGVGASAGGLEAFKVLLESLPADTGLAFVIIQHLAAGQESMLTDILSRFTRMLVSQVEDGMHVESNRIYVIPPGTTMTLADGLLKLSPKGKSLRPIDAFLSSLAAERKTQAIGIVLSGTGMDGTEGLKAVKAEGGITFAQDPESAQYAGMPQSAISAEAVDFVLSPGKIAKELLKISKNPHLVRAEIVTQEPKVTKETGLRKIFRLLKATFNVDFTHYKEGVVNRRVTRRMVINHMDSITKYAEYLGTNPDELKALFDDMLIGVTSFFREPKTFDTLKENLLSELLKNRLSTEPIRMWIPGCSTGEEAYSFAIALQEFLDENGPLDVQVQIFGTDVNEKNIDKARQGIYPKSIETNVSENRLKRFFTSFNGSYQIAKFIRDKCVFAKQDLTADPPFSNLDLISCRNMLIYFDPELQERIVPILHYALKPNGFLILGESESIGKFTTLFEQVQKKSFIYTKRNPQLRVNVGANFGFEALVPQDRKTVLKEPLKKDAITLLRDEVDRLLITEYVPAAMLINNNLDILVFRGNVTPYISPESGQTSLNVTKILRKELRSEIQTLVYTAKKENKPVVEEAIRFQFGELQKTANIQVIPLQRGELFFLVLFEDVSSAAAHLRKTIELTTSPKGRASVKDSQIRELRQELESSKQTLQTVVENQEATTEELRSAMEEVQSSNEELQSTNEELETAKEELQSSNEELTTLNDELKNRNQALATLSDNQANINRNVDPAVVMVDGSLKIRLFTPSAQKILNLVPTDVGLPLSNVRLAISVPDLEKTLLDVVKSLGSETIEVSDEKGRFYELRIRPYVTEDNRIDGAVLSFIDVNELRLHENKLQLEETKYRTLAENSPDIIVRFDKKLQFLYVNSAVKKMSPVFPKDYAGKTSEEAGLPQEIAESWNHVLQNVIKFGKVEKGEFEISGLRGNQVYQYVIVPEFSVKGEVETVLSLLKNITLAKKAEEDLKKQASLIDLSPDAIIMKKLDDTVTFWSLGAQTLYGWTKQEALGQKNRDLLKTKFPEPFEEILEQLKKNGRWSGEKIQYTKSGREVIVDSRWLIQCDVQNETEEILETNVDITERKKLEDSLKESEARFLFALKKTPVTVGNLDRALRFTWVYNPQSGYTSEDLIGKKFGTGMDFENIDEIFAFMNNVIAKGIQARLELRGKTPLGERIFDFYIEPKRNFQNEITGLSFTSLNITEIKKAEEALKKSEEEYSSLFSNMMDGFAYCQMVFDEAGKPVDFVYIQVNDAFERITGLKKDLIIGKKVSRAILGIKEENPELFEIYGRVALTGKKEKFEYFLKPLKLWLRVSVYSPAKGYFAAVLEDITERKKSEAEREIIVEFLRIANSTAGTRDLVKGAVDFFQKQSGCEAVGIRLKEGDEYPYYVTMGFPPEHVRLENQICARDESGYTIRDPNGNPLIECMCGNVVSGRFDPSKDFFTEKGSFWTNNTTLLLATTTAESRGKTRNCCKHEGYESIALIPLAVGNSRLGLLQLNDKRKGMFTLDTVQMWERIADRLALALLKTIAEEALRKSELKYKDLADHLEDLVEERTAQLRDSERLAVIGATAGMVGHDIRNPLQAIASDVYLVKTELASVLDSPEKKETFESLLEIEKNVEYINKIVADFQDLAKPLNPKIEETDLEKIVHSTLANLTISENVAINQTIRKDFPKIKADHSFLRRILTNLTNNAIQAMPNGGKLTIAAASKNGKAYISVEDTGEGIPENVRSKLFAPLVTTKPTGHGFGLAAVKKFTEAMGGTVTFESEVGKGTKFIIELPLN